MIRIQFNDQPTRYEAEFKAISQDVVEITGENIPKNSSGFKVYRMNGNFLGNYTEYTKIIAEKDNSIQFGK